MTPAQDLDQRALAGAVLAGEGVDLAEVAANDASRSAWTPPKARSTPVASIAGVVSFMRLGPAGTEADDRAATTSTARARADLRRLTFSAPGHGVPVSAACTHITRSHSGRSR